MSTKELKTRIRLRYDSFENWSKVDAEGKGIELLEGEVAIAYLGPTKDTTRPDPDHEKHPVMFKVGPGDFNALPWVSGLAADVYSWAKKNEEDFLAWLDTRYIKEYTDTDTKYGIEYDSDKKEIKLIENGTNLSISAADFIKDGMIDSVIYNTDDPTDPKLVITWNTDAGKDAVEIPLAGLIDAMPFDEVGDGLAIKEENGVKTLGFDDDCVFVFWCGNAEGHIPHA